MKKLAFEKINSFFRKLAIRKYFKNKKIVFEDNTPLNDEQINKFLNYFENRIKLRESLGGYVRDRKNQLCGHGDKICFNLDKTGAINWNKEMNKFTVIDNEDNVIDLNDIFCFEVIEHVDINT